MTKASRILEPLWQPLRSAMLNEEKALGMRWLSVVVDVITVAVVVSFVNNSRSPIITTALGVF